MNRFGPTHYVPILRWKRAEQSALARLAHYDAACLTPLVEMVPQNLGRNGKKALDIQETANRVSCELFRAWGERPFFIDLHNLPEDDLIRGNDHFLTLLAERAGARGLSMAPTTGLGRGSAYQSAVLTVVSKHREGACLRLSRDDLTRPTLVQDVESTLSFLRIDPEQVDLLVDLGIRDESEHNAPAVHSVCELVPHMAEWRNFVVAGGAFPVDLTQLQKNRIHRTVRRLDWISWRDQATADPPPARLPTYSDYTILHARYQERKGQSNYSASIRYTSTDYWVIMRGESVRNEDGPGVAQWPANAQLLCEQPEYCTESFCDGDKYIREMSLQTEHTGSPTTWLQAGINHHMTFVVRQLASPLGTSAVAVP